MHVASLSHSKDGNAIAITERPLWAEAAEQAGDALVAITGHWLCCNIPAGAYRIRWGPLDDDGWTDRSLGYLMSRLGSWIISGFGTARFRRQVALLPVTVEWVREHFPDSGWPFIPEEEE